jgi:hypothetical protein
MVMVLLLAAALATAPPPPVPSTAAQATATIRVLTGVRLKFDAATNPGAPPARDQVLRLSDGTRQSVKLIEFQ